MKLNQAEVDLYYWQNDTAGSFKAALFELICKADLPNQKKLSLAFPDEVRAIQAFQNQRGYWEWIKKEMKK